MTTETPTPFANLDIAGVLLNGIVATLAAAGQTTLHRKQEAMMAVLTLLPRDTMEMITAGHILMFNELTADAGKDILSGMPDTLKLKAQSNAIALSKTMHQNIETFLKLKDRKGIGAHPAQEETARPQQTAPEPVPAPEPEPAPAAAAAPPPAQPEASPQPATDSPEAIVPFWRNKEPESWLDQPRETWIVETPAQALTRTAARTQTPPAAEPREAGKIVPALPLLAAETIGASPGP